MQRNKPIYLGLVANTKRSIQSGAQYAKYFLSGVQGNEITLMDNGNVTDTLNQMKKIVQQTLAQTKAIAPVLKGSSKQETARNLYNFLYNHVQYTKDNPLREQLRTPARTWRDRSRGVDCDCYSIFISSVLTNLGVPHFFRIAGYNGGDYQHVYVVVPDAGREIIIDPVLDSFNTEHPYTSKKDFNMKVTMLNGGPLGACATQAANPLLPNTTQPEVAEFVTFQSLQTSPMQMVQPEAVAPITQTQTPEVLQASIETEKATEKKLMWGLGLSALALALLSAFSNKKTSLSGAPKQRTRLSVVQM